MSIYFISSPGQLAHRALSVLNKDKSKYKTIVTTETIKPFLKNLTDVNIITLATEPNLITRDTKTSLITNTIKSKLEFWKYFSTIKNEDIHLFFTSWGIVPISYVKKLSKHNNVYVYPEHFVDEMYNTEKGLTESLMKLSAKLLLGLDVYIVRWNNTPVWELKLNTFPMKIVNCDEFKSKLPKEFMFDKQQLKGKEVLFLGSKFEIDCKETPDKIRLTNNLMKFLQKEFEGKFILKAHPIDKKLYGIMKYCKDKIPAHVIAESLFEHDWKYIIGYHSEALVSSKLHTNATVISLIRMYEFTNPKVRQYWLDTFYRQNIKMPKDLEELKCMMK